MEARVDVAVRGRCQAAQAHRLVLAQATSLKSQPLMVGASMIHPARPGSVPKSALHAKYCSLRHTDCRSTGLPWRVGSIGCVALCLRAREPNAARCSCRLQQNFAGHRQAVQRPDTLACPMYRTGQAKKHGIQKQGGPYLCHALLSLLASHRRVGQVVVVHALHIEEVLGGRL